LFGKVVYLPFYTLLFLSAFLFAWYDVWYW